MLCCVLPWLPVQTAVLAGVRVRSAQFGASQQPHSVFPVQWVQRVATGNQKSEVIRGQRSEFRGHKVRDDDRGTVYYNKDVRSVAAGYL